VAIPGEHEMWGMRASRTRTEPEWELALTEDQQEIVEMIKEVALKYGVEVEVVDVAKANFLQRVVQRKFEKIQAFPTLVTDSGEMCQGVSTKKKIEAFLSKASKS
jgi:ABC-type uncharacterized transport system substrate-binding protein